jgi:hypothetical protein
VSDPKYDDIVRWTDEGDAFIIINKNEFSDKVLPIFFKHKNLPSFVRQLNIYGFKKTKYKSEEHCFAHRDFRRDNKKLILNMRRKTKRKSSDKKSMRSDESYIRKSEVVEMFEKMNKRIDDQDNKIEQLIKANREFKNSVLALYTQLEKSKEREKRFEKLLYEVVPLTQKTATNTLLNEPVTDQLKEKMATENMFRLDNNDLFSLFTSFLKNFMQKLNQNDINNVFYDNKNNYNYYSRKSPSPNRHKVLPFDVQKYSQANMLENGPLLEKEAESSLRVDIYGNPVRKRENKALRQVSLLDHEIWEKLSDSKSIHANDNIDFLENLHKDKDAYLYSCDNSVISEIDHPKDRSMDNISVGSNRKFTELLSHQENKLS